MRRSRGIMRDPAVVERGDGVWGPEVEERRGQDMGRTNNATEVDHAQKHARYTAWMWVGRGWGSQKRHWQSGYTCFEQDRQGR